MRGIAASFVIVGDGVQPPIVRGGVVLDDTGHVLAVGETDALVRAYPAVKFEQHRAVLMPGLVNAHTHLELSAMRGLVPGGRGFGPWVALLVSERARLLPDDDAEAIQRAVSELIDSGTVAVGEVSNMLSAVRELGRAPLLGRVFHEVFGLRRDAAEVMLGLADQRRAEFADWPSNLSYAPAPHTPYSVHPEMVRELIRRARALPARSSIHLCEHAAERAYLRDGSGPYVQFLIDRGATSADWTPPGLDPVRYAAALGALAKDVIAVHLTDAQPDELALVAHAGVPVVLCPRSNLHIELKLPPLIEMLKAGIRPALGTDSLASNSSLDVLEEARALAARFPSVAPRTLLAMATSYGAEVLGLQSRVGSLSPGLAPGVLAFVHDAELPSDPERFVLSRAASRRTLLAPPSLHPLLAEEAA